MKKLIFILLCVSLAIVFSVSVLAQSGEEDISISDTTSNEQLQNAGIAYCPFAQDDKAGCWLLGDDGSKTGYSNPPGCCQFKQLQSQTVSSQDEGDSASAPSQIQRGCCWR